MPVPCSMVVKCYFILAVLVKELFNDHLCATFFLAHLNTKVHKKLQ